MTDFTDAALTRLALLAEPWRILQLAGLDEDEWQESILRSNARQLAILGARQGAGKSTSVAALNVLECLQPNRRCYIGGPSEDQSKEVLAKAAELLKNLDFVGPYVDKTELKATIIRMRNGSFIRALSSNQATGRGKTAHLITITEAALASDALINALTPSLAVTSGRLVLESTPFGQRGFFWSLFDDGSDRAATVPDAGLVVSVKVAGWTLARRTVERCTRISAGFIEDQKAKGEMYYSQEYECVFIAALGSVFNPDQIAAAFENGERPIFPNSPWVDKSYEPPGAIFDHRERPLFG